MKGYLDPCTCMGKNKNGLVYQRLINATVLSLLTTILHFYTHLTFKADIVLFLLLMIFLPKYNICTCNPFTPQIKENLNATNVM